MEQFILQPLQVLRRGLRLVGVGSEVQDRRGKRANVEQFRSIFGPHPSHLATCWNEMIVERQLVPIMEISLLGFFLALNFLRVYPRSETLRSALFGNIELKRARNLTWQWIDFIDLMYQHKIFWPSTFDSVFVASVDGSHKKSNETRHPTLRKDPKTFSFKHHRAGHNVQVVLHCFLDKIMDVFIARGGQNDMGNVNDSQMYHKIPAGKRCVVDGGYVGKLDKFSGYNQFDSEEVKHFKKRVKARHETINKRMNDYRVMDDQWRHNRDKFPACVRAVAILIQCGLEDTDPESANPLFNA